MTKKEVKCAPLLALISAFAYCLDAEMSRNNAVVAVASSTAWGVWETLIPEVLFSIS